MADKRTAAIALVGDVYTLAFTRATKQLVAACNHVGQGRILGIGNIGWLTDSLILEADNKILAVNIFHWLSGNNPVDIKRISIPEHIVWGQSAKVAVQLYNDDAHIRPEITCVLESDRDAIVSEPIRKTRSIPPKTTTHMQWLVRPQVLGEQKLRLSIHIKDKGSLFFDKLPPTICQAPGYLTLETKNEKGQQQTQFETGEQFFVDGAFHGDDPLSYELVLTFDDGLIELPAGHQLGNGVGRWHMQAVAPGEHQLTLSLPKTKQSLTALLKVNLSLPARLVEVKAAYLYPLEAEIIARLRQIDERFTDQRISKQSFEILPVEEFIKEVYPGDTATWLYGVLAAARREQWSNRELLEIVLDYLSPVYIVNRGGFIPFGPKLASHLAWLHPEECRYLENNLLCSLEIEDIRVKQNVAAYLLHEKYGHGFFYTYTKLGKQLALLEKHSRNDDAISYDAVSILIDDSSLIVNEGFSAWLELTFLKQLDRDTRQAFDIRSVLLLDKGTGLLSRMYDEGSFFEKFWPRFDSRYREGYQYLDFISQTFHMRCAIEMLMVAADVDLGVKEDEAGGVIIDEDRIRYYLLEATSNRWRSHFRLRKIATLLRKSKQVAKSLVKKRYCPVDCKDKECPLEAFVREQTTWRT